MKQLVVIALSVLLFSCGKEAKMESDGKYGENFNADSALSVGEAIKAMSSVNEMPVVIKGKVTEVCKSEGCWLMLKNEGGEDLYIDIAEKKFHLTPDIEGKTVAVKGVLTKEPISVEELQQMAREAGKTDEEVKAITSPKDDIAMEATGLVIQK
ncbi:MAG: DUF4920 domain-containing protein [Bacteroidia bacterium]|nr:DUF4920 domain-containing protein [Bacteroidia bacterium]